jgi:ABC-type polysaccharide/polyol phosphate export permease
MWSTIATWIMAGIMLIVFGVMIAKDKARHVTVE